MEDNICKNKIIITIAVLSVVVIVALSIALSGAWNGNLEFQIIRNQKTGEPLGVCMSLFVYLLMWLLFGLVPSACVMLFAMLVYFILHRKDPNLFKKGHAPSYEEEFEYAGKLSLCATYVATLFLIFLQASGIITFNL